MLEYKGKTVMSSNFYELETQLRVTTDTGRKQKFCPMYVDPVFTDEIISTYCYK